MFIVSLLLFVLVSGAGPENGGKEDDVASVQDSEKVQLMDNPVDFKKGHHQLVPPDSLNRELFDMDEVLSDAEVVSDEEEERDETSPAIPPPSPENEFILLDTTSNIDAPLTVEKEIIPARDLAPSVASVDKPPQASAQPSSLDTEKDPTKSSHPLKPSTDKRRDMPLQLEVNEELLFDDAAEELPDLKDLLIQLNNPSKAENVPDSVDTSEYAYDIINDEFTTPRKELHPTHSPMKDDVYPSDELRSGPAYETTFVHPATILSDPNRPRPVNSSSSEGPVFPSTSSPRAPTNVHYMDSKTSPDTAVDHSTSSNTSTTDKGSLPAKSPTTVVDSNNGLVAKYPSDTSTDPITDSNPDHPRDPIHTTPISPITIYNPLTSVDKRITRLSLYAVFGFCGVCFLGLASSFIYTTCFGGTTLLILSKGVGNVMESGESVISSSVSSVATSADSAMELGKSMPQMPPTELTVTTMNIGGSTETLASTSVDVNQIDLI